MQTAGSGKTFGIFVLLVLLALATIIYVVASLGAAQQTVVSPNLSGDTAGGTDLQNYADWVQGLVLQYQVDVFYAHHGVVGEYGSQAMKCLAEKGSFAAFSQRNRLLHLVCFSDDEKTLFDTIIAKIIEGDSKWKNPKSQLFRAGKVNIPETMADATQEQKVSWYFRQLQQEWGGIRVRLQFEPGDIAFFPTE